MRKNLIIYFLLIIAVLLNSCNSGNKSQSSDTTVKIGAVLPLSGDLANYAVKVKKGMDLAIDKINENNSKFKIEIIYEDSKSQTSEGVKATNKLVSINKVPAIIGEISSSTTLSMIPVINQNKVFLIAPASSSPKLAGVSKYFVRNWPNDLYEAEMLARFAYDSIKLRNLALVCVNNDYGIGLQEKMKSEFTRNGGLIVFSELYDLKQKDFKTLVQKIKNSNPDGIYMAGYTEMGLLTKQIREAGINVQILGCTNYGDNEVIRLAEGKAENAIFATPMFQTESENIPQSMKMFVDNYKKKYEEEPTLFEANGYDAVMIIYNAFVAGNKTGENIAKYVYNMKTYNGAAGNIVFNNEGDIQLPISFKTISDSKIMEK